jgi:hypothetical protein
MTDEIICATCGRSHPVEDSELTFGLPDVVFDLPESEREVRCKIGKEIVSLDDRTFFLRGLLPLKVAGRAREYCLGVWVEVSEDVLSRVRELWSDANQEQEPRMPGTLANKVPFHSDTVGLRLALQLTGPTTRPQFILDTADHSLYVEQSRGIDEHRAIEYSDPAARKTAIEQALGGDSRKPARASS